MKVYTFSLWLINSPVNLEYPKPYPPTPQYPYYPKLLNPKPQTLIPDTS